MAPRGRVTQPSQDTRKTNKAKQPALSSPSWPNLALNSDVDQDTFGTVEKHNIHDSQEVSPFPAGDHKATRNRHDSTTHTNMKHN